MRTETRHQLKHDKFAETVGHQYSWAVEHRSTLTYSAILIAVILAAVIGGNAYYNQRNSKANTALGNALETYNAPIMPPQPNVVSFASAEERARAAYPALEKVANEYSHTKAGAMARYLAGVTAKSLNDPTKAESALKQAIDAGDKDVASLAKLALAGLYAQTNKESQAVEIYKDLADHPTNAVGKSTAQLQLAQMYEAKQPAEAAKLYAQIQKDDPTGPAGQIAARSLNASKQ